MKTETNSGPVLGERKLIRIAAGGVELQGDLMVPDKAIGLVIFSHGSGSSRFSPRNIFVAQQLQKSRIATLLVDLLTRSEDDVSTMRFNIELLTERLASITKKMMDRPEVAQLPIGLFGASTGAASALRVAARLPECVKAIVSRGGRPDLSILFLKVVSAPTLLLVGESDHEVLALNHLAYDELRCEKRLSIIPGATHLFEEAGALEEVSGQAAQWFGQYLTAGAAEPKKRLPWN